MISIYIYIFHHIPTEWPMPSIESPNWSPILKQNQALRHHTCEESWSNMAPVILGGSTRYLKRPLFTVLIHLGCDRCGKTTIQRMCRKKRKNKKIIKRSGAFFMDGYELGFQNLRDVLLNRFFGTSGTTFGGVPSKYPKPCIHRPAASSPPRCSIPKGACNIC